MKHSLRLTLALSATVFFVSACSNTPYEDTSETGSTSNIPEAGPLTGGGTGGYGGNYGGSGYTQNQQGGSNAYYPPQTAQPQQPQYGSGGGYGQNQGGQQGGGYDNYASGGSYDQSQGGQQGGGYDTAGNTNNGGDAYSGGNNDSYDSYGSNTGGSSNGGGDYYANSSSGGNSGGGDYYAGGGGGGSIGSSSGRAAVQIFASGSSSKAQQVRSSMASRGLNAVVDSVDGLYKVRVPFGSESEARSNLMRVRSASGESGAFVTFR